LLASQGLFTKVENRRAMGKIESQKEKTSDAYVVAKVVGTEKEKHTKTNQTKKAKTHPTTQKKNKKKNPAQGGGTQTKPKKKKKYRGKEGG